MNDNVSTNICDQINFLFVQLGVKFYFSKVRINSFEFECVSAAPVHDQRITRERISR